MGTYGCFLVDWMTFSFLRASAQLYLRRNHNSSVCSFAIQLSWNKDLRVCAQGKGLRDVHPPFCPVAAFVMCNVAMVNGGSNSGESRSPTTVLDPFAGWILHHSPGRVEGGHGRRGGSWSIAI